MDTGISAHYLGVDQFVPDYVISSEGAFSAFFKFNNQGKLEMIHSYTLSPFAYIPAQTELLDILNAHLSGTISKYLSDHPNRRIEKAPDLRTDFSGKRIDFNIRAGNLNDRLGGTPLESVHLMTAYNVFRYYDATATQIFQERLAPLIAEGGYFVDGFQGERDGELQLSIYQKNNGQLVLSKVMILVGKSMTDQRETIVWGRLRPEIERILDSGAITCPLVEENIQLVRKQIAEIANQNESKDGSDVHITIEGSFVVFDFSQRETN